MKYAVRVGKYIALLLLMVCMARILTLGDALSLQGDMILYTMTTGGLRPETLKEMRTQDETLEEYIPFTASGSYGQQTVSNKDLAREITAGVVLVDGDSSLLIRSEGELLKEDVTGCLLSSEAAWQLFGETGVAGGQVVVGKIPLNVRGIFESEENIVLVPAAVFLITETKQPENAEEGAVPEEEENAFAYDKLAMKPDLSPALRLENVRAFENRWSLGAEKTDCLIYDRLSVFLTWLVPAAALILILAMAASRIWQSRRFPFRLLLYILALIIVLFVFRLICGQRFSFPVDLIPSRWSDFDFWGETLTTFKSSMAHILFMDKSDYELSYYKPLSALAAWALGGLACFLLSWRLFRMEEDQPLLPVLIVVCLVEFAALYLTGSTPGFGRQKALLIYFCPWWLIGKYLFKKH